MLLGSGFKRKGGWKIAGYSSISELMVFFYSNRMKEECRDEPKRERVFFSSFCKEQARARAQFNLLGLQVHELIQKGEFISLDT